MSLFDYKKQHIRTRRTLVSENTYLMTVNTTWRVTIGKPGAIMKVTCNVGVTRLSPYFTVLGPSTHTRVNEKQIDLASFGFLLHMGHEGGEIAKIATVYGLEFRKESNAERLYQIADL